MMRLGMRAQPRPGVRRRGAALAVTTLLLAGVTLAGCGGHQKGAAPTPTPSPATRAAPAPVETQTRIAHLEGKLPQAARDRVIAKVGAAVDAWFQAAYVGGSYPRAATTFRTAFPGFTPTAVATARTRLDVMSNAAIATRIDTVVPVTRLVALDLVAAKGRAIGVTARVRLVFRTTGKVAARELVRGQLDFTPATGKWQVFAFDVTKLQTTQKSGQKAGGKS